MGPMRRSTHIRGSLLALAAVLTGCSGSPSADARSEDANPASPPDGSARPAANGPSEPTTSLPVGTGDPLDEDAPRLHIDDVGIRLARERAPLVRLVGGAFGTREPDAHELPALYDALAEQAEHDKGAAARAGEAWSSTLVLFAGPGTHQRVLSDSIYNASLAGYTRFGIAVHDPSHDARRMLVVEPPTLVLERPAGDGDALDDDPTEDPRGITVALDDGGYSVGRGAEGPAPTRATDQALVEIGRQTDRLTGLDPNARMLVISASDHTPLQRLVDAMVVARKHGLTDLRLSGANAHDHRFDVRRALAADAIGLGDLQDSGGSLGLEAFGNLEGFGHGSGHIFNLGHGITPGVNPDHVTAFADAVVELSPQYHKND